MTDEELQEEVLRCVRSAPGSTLQAMQKSRRERQSIMREAASRFPESHIAGAIARMELTRHAAVRLITFRNVARDNLRRVTEAGCSKRKIEEWRARSGSLERQVEEMKQLCRKVEAEARSVITKWKAEQPDKS